MATIGQQLTAPESGWKRYDDRDFRMKFNAPTAFRQSYTQYGTYLGTLSYIDSNHQSTTDTISFKFTGKKLIVGVLYFNTNEHSGFTIEVDGVNLGNYVTGLKRAITSSTVGFVKTDFSEGEHSVVIRNLDKSTSNSVNSTFALDYIDIDVAGNLKVEVGEPLTSPDSGWKRIDDTDPRLVYTPSFTYSSNSNCYNGGAHQVVPNASEQTCKFRFYGTKLRLISLFYDPYPSSGVFIKIDGKAEEPIVINKPLAYQVLAYEVIGLELGYHEVVIGQHVVSGSSGGLIIDAIDIDFSGRLFHPDEVTNVANLEVGKRIRCHYQSSIANTIGSFSGLGEQTSVFLPPSGSATPNGDFYFIMVENWNGRKLLVADRNIQNAISWDVINANGMVGGLSVSFAGPKEAATLIRLLTGGINASDKDNEWDKYIVNSTLNGKVNAGDNHVWNYNGGASWTSTTNAAGTGNRTGRGANGNVGASGYNPSAYIAGATATGFRPVMEVTILPVYRSLIKHDEIYKKYNKTVKVTKENVIPAMTSNTTPSGVASASSVYNTTFYEPFKSFDRATNQGWLSSNGQKTGWLAYEFPATKNITLYKVKSTGTPVNIEFSAHPKNWTFEGSNDGTNWTILDTQSNHVWTTASEVKSFSMDNADAYKKYRLNISLNNGHANYVGLGDVEMYEPITPPTPSAWSTISTTLPSVNTFIKEAMNDLSVLDRKSTDFTQGMSVEGALGSGHLFKASIDLNKYSRIMNLIVK